MEYRVLPHGIEVKASCFDLDETLSCGQCFRWDQLGPGNWRGGVSGRTIIVRQSEDVLLLEGADLADFQELWRPYFDLDRDYNALRQEMAEHPVLAPIVAFAPGIHILAQPAWEALCSFLISQNNNIPRIRSIVSRLCADFGEPLADGLFAFPTPEALACVTLEQLAPLRCGYRAPYLIDAARKVADGHLDLEAIARLPLDEARERLRSVKGVGPKVAECVLLYGMGRMDAFPADVWIKRTMGILFPQGLPSCFAHCAGLAQQYIYHWSRCGPGREILQEQSS